MEQRPWDYFGTFTTRYPITLRSARRLMEKLNTKVSLDEDSMIFWVAERFELRDGYHMHALVKSPITSRSIWQWWFRRYGRAEVRKFNPAMGAAGYVSKYVTKQAADYDVLTGSALTLKI